MIKKIDLASLLNWTDRQKEAWQAIMDGFVYILYGGARGGGKSRFLRWAAVAWLYFMFTVHGLRHLRVGLFCNTYTDLVDRQITKIRLEFPEWMGELKNTKEDGWCFFLCEAMGGGIIAFRNLDDPEKYQSSEFAAIFLDEITKILLKTFNVLRGSMRWPGVKNPLFLCATNPGGVGHSWVKRFWIDKDFPKEMQAISKKFKFIQSLPKDNPYLDESYWETLNSLPEDMRRAWVEGDWNIFEGQAFPFWRNEKHVIQPFEIPDTWIRWRSLDWGFADPFCCLWWAKSPNNGRTVIYKEAYFKDMTDDQQAKMILDMTLPNEKIVYTLADPSMWARKNFSGKVTTTSDEFAKYGVYLSKADNNRLQGKRKFDRLLADMPDGKPGILFTSNCYNCIRTIPSLARSERNPEDVDPKGEDHAWAAVMYGLSNFVLTTPVKKPYTNPWITKGESWLKT
jgi:phage terminase large subunit